MRCGLCRAGEHEAQDVRPALPFVGCEPGNLFKWRSPAVEARRKVADQLEIAISGDQTNSRTASSGVMHLSKRTPQEQRTQSR